MVQKFKVTGMTCAACAARVEKVTSKIANIKKVDVNLLAGTLFVTAEQEVSNDLIMKAVEDAGYGISIYGEKRNVNKAESDSLASAKKRIFISSTFLLILMYFTMGHMVHLPMPSWYHGDENVVVGALLQLFLTLPIVIVNRGYFIKGTRAMLKGAANMDSLIAVGSGASFIYSVIVLFSMAYHIGRGSSDLAGVFGSDLYFESAAMILTLITIGKYLEARAKRKTGDAVMQLMDMSPKTATVLTDGVACTVPIADVKVGDTVVVRAGDRIPVDGTVLKGRSSVDQSALTGESLPLDIEVGDMVKAASISKDGYLEVRADMIGEDTTFAKVIQLVEDAGGSKAPIARLADKIAGVFVPVVMVIALITFAVWLLVGQSFAFSLNAAISVLVISCPCALGLATPVAIMVGTGRGARMGILFKNAEALESLQKIDTVVLDKTGTLTTGKPAVTDIMVADADEQLLLSVAASLELQSEHPFAKAIILRYGKCAINAPESFETLPGRGISGIIDGVRYYGGNKRLMDHLQIKVPDYEELQMQGKTPLYFACEDKRYLGAIAAADVLKEDSSFAVAALKKMGLEVVMLTGDNRVTASHIAENAGITRVISDVLPDHKANEICNLRSIGKNVLMVGDGINDAPALVTADVGMAISSGTDIAMESADIVLMQHSLAGVAKAIALSKATIRNIRGNLFWAFFYNCLGIPIAAGVLYPLLQLRLSPMIAAAAMSLSSLFVVTNALRLRFFDPDRGAKKEKNDIHITQEVEMMETIIKVDGMMCPHCKARVENACKAVEGTIDAVVDLTAKEVTVTGIAARAQLEEAIKAAGYEIIEG